ncbi:MAG TPA: hypothetical protein VFZ00_28480 [Solirubrobacter sp.]|nr:hypothetical protein [Solirubrobacter sp.]
MSLSPSDQTTVPLREAQSWRDVLTGRVFEVVREHGGHTRYVEVVSGRARSTVSVMQLRATCELLFDPHTGFDAEAAHAA